MDILLDPSNKPAKEFFIFLKIQDGRRRSQICDAFHFFNVFAIIWIRFIGSRQNLAWTYYLTLGTNLRKNFSFFSKSKMAADGQKFAMRYTYGLPTKKPLGRIDPFAITSKRLIGSRQNLAWTYYLTLGTTPRKNFSFFSKSKMAATAITANYEIAHNLKSIHLETQFFPSTHVFKGKECNEAIICVLRS